MPAPRATLFAWAALALSCSAQTPSPSPLGCVRTTIGSLAISGAPAGASPVSVAAPPALGTGAFTVEWWQYIGNVPPYIPFVFAFSSTLGVSLSPLAGAVLWVAGSPTASSYAPIRSIWQHWAVVRSGTTVTLFASGTPVAKNASVAANLTAVSLTIGGGGSGAGGAPAAGSFTGLLAEFRVVLGVALYAGAFVPPTQPFDAVSGTALLLHAATPGTLLSDASSVGAAVSATSSVAWSSSAPFTCFAPSGSFAFSGSASSIATVPVAATQLGTRDWTIELLVRAQSVAYGRLVSVGACCSGVVLAVEFSTGSPALVVSNVNTWANWVTVWGAWLHVAIVRNGTAVAWFIEGRPIAVVLTGAATNFSATPAVPMYIGGDTTFRAFSGLVSNFRVTVGAAVYPVSFTPSAPLAVAPGTQLLLLARSSALALADSSGAGVAVTAVGVTWSATAPPGASGSLTFSGSASSIVTVPAGVVQLGTGDWTIEFWVNAASSAFSRIFSIGVCCGGSLSVELQTTGTSTFVTPTGNVGSAQ